MEPERFEWDEAKRRFNLAKHGVDFATAKRVFAGPRLEQIDARRDYGEQRMISIGTASGLELVVVYTLRGDVCRLISARRANERERQAYRRAFPDIGRA